MLTYILGRISHNRYGTYGVLIDDQNIPFALTLELPWRGNAKNISCIPTGTYKCKRVVTPRHGSVFQVMNVPGRTNILFHKGNLTEDSAGCILVGERFDPVKSMPGIAASGDGFDEFMGKLLSVNEFTIRIIDAFKGE